MAKAIVAPKLPDLRRKIDLIRRSSLLVQEGSKEKQCSKKITGDTQYRSRSRASASCDPLPSPYKPPLKGPVSPLAPRRTDGDQLSPVGSTHAHYVLLHNTEILPDDTLTAEIARQALAVSRITNGDVAPAEVV